MLRKLYALSTPGEMRQIRTRNVLLLRALRRLYRNYNGRKLTALSAFGCPHCVTSKCTECRWSIAAGVSTVATCFDAEFDGVSLNDVANQAHVQVHYYQLRAAVIVSGIDDDEYAACVTFLKAHIKWAKGLLDA